MDQQRIVIESVSPQVDGVTGYQVPPADPKALADAINKVLRDRKLAESMGKAGRKRVEDHVSWKSIAQRTLKMYAELLHEKERAFTVG